MRGTDVAVVHRTGTVVKHLGEKGFGFLRDDAGQEYFFHASSCRPGGFSELTIGQPVEFDAEKTPKGWRATQVDPVEA